MKNSTSKRLASALVSAVLLSMTTTMAPLLAKSESSNVNQIYEFKAKALDGHEIDFNQYRGDVLLIVNTASKCGFTPQYKGLEELNDKFKAKGLRVLGFPCNQFGGQEPGNAAEIESFCKDTYAVDFQMFEKIDVNGSKADPIFKYLTDTAPGVMGSKAIKWNFTKFLIDRKGHIVKRYAPSVKPSDIASEIEKLI